MRGDGGLARNKVCLDLIGVLLVTVVAPVVGIYVAALATLPPLYGETVSTLSSALSGGGGNMMMKILMTAIMSMMTKGLR